MNRRVMTCCYLLLRILFDIYHIFLTSYCRHRCCCHHHRHRHYYWILLLLLFPSSPPKQHHYHHYCYYYCFLLRRCHCHCHFYYYSYHYVYYYKDYYDDSDDDKRRAICIPNQVAIRYHTRQGVLRRWPRGTLLIIGIQSLFIWHVLPLCNIQQQ